MHRSRTGHAELQPEARARSRRSPGRPLLSDHGALAVMVLIAEEVASRGDAIADRALAREALRRLNAEGVTVDGASIDAKEDRLRRKYADSRTLGENQFPPINSQASRQHVGEDHLTPASAGSEVDVSMTAKSDSGSMTNDGRASRASARVVKRPAERTKGPANVIRFRLALTPAEHIDVQMKVGAARELVSAVTAALQEVDAPRSPPHTEDE